MAVLTMIAHLLIKIFLYSLGVFFMAILGLKLYVKHYKAICKCKTKLHGKIALITGGNAGIGLETARDLANRGATVVIACRNEARSRDAVADIIRTTGNPNVEYRHLDLSISRSIRIFAKDFDKAFDRLDILVNNAGALGLEEKLSEDGIDIVTQINYVGPFLLTNLLMKKLIASKPSRIVIVSSIGHKIYNFDLNDIIGKRKVGVLKKYCNSKLYNVMWAKALAKRLPEDVTANSLHPGPVKTDILNRVNKFVRGLVWIFGSFFKTPVEGAQTTIHLCVAPDLAKVSGQYFSDCKIVRSTRISNNDKLVDQLWEETMMILVKKGLIHN